MIWEFCIYLFQIILHGFWKLHHQNYIFLKIFNFEFWYIKAWFTDHSSQPLEIEIYVYNNKNNAQLNLEIKHMSMTMVKTFAKIFVINIGIKIINQAKKSQSDVFKNASKRAIQNPEAAGDFIVKQVQYRNGPLKLSLTSQTSQK